MKHDIEEIFRSDDNVNQIKSNQIKSKFSKMLT